MDYSRQFRRNLIVAMMYKKGGCVRIGVSVAMLYEQGAVHVLMCL